MKISRETKFFLAKYIVAPIIVGVILASFSYFILQDRNTSKITTNENNSGQHTTVENTYVKNTQVPEKPIIEQRKEEQKEKQETSFKPQEKEITITKTNFDNKTRIEEIGESGYKINSKWAWDAAVEDAKKKLAERDIFYDSYDIDHSKSSNTQTENDGWTATVVIFVYK